MSDTTQADSEQSDNKPVQDQEPAKAKKTAKKAAKKTAKKTAKKVAKKTAKKAAKKTAKRATKKAAKKEELPNNESSSSNNVSEKPQVKVKAKAQEKNEDKAESPQNTAPKKEIEEAQQAENSQAKQSTDQSDNQQSDNSEQNKQRRGRVPGKGKVQNNNQNKQGKQNNQNKNQRGNNGNKNNPNKNNRNKNNKNNNRRHKNQKEKKVELTGPPVAVNGMLELAPKGFGFLRILDKGLEQASDDVFVTPDLIRTHGLRLGVWIHGEAMQGPRGLQLTKIDSINGKTTEEARKLPHFEELKAVNPDKRISFETTGDRFSTRVLDIIAPVGRGQRGLIVSPPRSGKTTLMMHMAEAIQEKYDEQMHLMILLVDERPEEVTEFKHSLPDAEIFASSNDSGPKNHCRIAELCIERAKRLVEAGEHVFILMDSITRLARAYNSAMGGDKSKGGGRGRGIQSGGIISGALEMPRKLFAAARNTRTAGSLTIIATALVHTNSRADDAIFQEFKGTGNMELVLDRRIAERYIYPAVDIFKSGTRREELILPEIHLHKINLIRRGLAGHRAEEAMERLTFFLKRFNNNAQMLLEIKG